MKNMKMEKVTKISKVFGFTQNPRRLPMFAVVVATYFDEILDDFHVFSECVFFLKKANNQFWEVSVFPRKSGFSTYQLSENDY